MKAKIKLMSIAIVFLVGASTLSILLHQAKSATSGLVGYWKFDEGSGTHVYDSSDNGNIGTLVNGPQWVDGLLNGMALSFDGFDDHVSISDSPSLDVSGNQVSIEFWMKPTVDLPISDKSMYIFDKGDAYLGIIHGADPNYGKLEFAFPFSTLNPVDFYSTTWAWASNTWYFIAFTYDGNRMRLYVNGALENTVANTGNIHSSGFPLSIGSRTSGDQEFFKGTLDEFSIYNYARTAQEILEDYNAFKPNSQSPFWMQWWFWTIIALGAVVLILAFTTVHYRKKPSISKETNAMQSKATQRANKVCPKCGANLPAGSKFCGKCGTSLE